MALSDNILAYWNLNDDGSGNVSLVDSTGNSNTLTNDSGVTLGSGKIGGDAVFNGGGQYLYSSSIPAINWGTGDFSYEVWVNPASYGFSPVSDFGETIVDFRSSGSGGSFLNITTSGYIRLWGATQYTSSTTKILLNSWTQLILTRTSGIYNIYTNGVLTDTFADSGDSYDSQNIILGKNYDGLVPYDGQIDEVGIWNRALSSDDVAALYNSGNGRYPFDLYFNAAVNNDWGTLGNWWGNSNFTTPATSLPDSATPVFIYGEVIENTAGDGICYCYGAEFHSTSFYYPLVLNTNGQLLQMYGTSGVFDGACSAGASFHDTCTLGGNGYVTGDAVFRNQSTNSGYVNGNAIFHEQTYNYGTINGNADVYYDGGLGTYPIGGIVNGVVSYLGWPAATEQYFNDQVTGSGAAYQFSDLNNWWADNTFTTRPINSAGQQVLPDAGTSIYVYGNGFSESVTISVYRARFYQNSVNSNPTILNVSSRAYFFDNSGNQSTIYGDCRFYNYSFFYGNNGTGIVYGSIYLYDNSGIYNPSGNNYPLVNNTIFVNSLQALENSFQFAFNYVSDGVSFDIPTGGGGSTALISRLLHLPWFIKL